VSWSAPANDGGSPVTGYTVTPYAGSTALSPVTVGAGTTTTTVTGLIDGTSYTFRITADNANGSSPAATTNAVTPTLLAAPPTNVQAAADDASATVWWTAPITGPTVTGYTVSAWDSSGNLVTTTSVDASETTAIVPGLVDGDSYTFTVAAQSTLGSSGASSPSNSVTPYSASGVAKPPNPTKLTATGLLGSATITWVAPKAPNNGAVTSYTVTVYDSKNTVVETLLFDPNTTSVTIGGLTGGTQYKFKIASTNVAGSSGGAMTPLITVL
jgi:titin